jgi:hypothetical protein
MIISLAASAFSFWQGDRRVAPAASETESNP